MWYLVRQQSALARHCLHPVHEILEGNVSRQTFNEPPRHDVNGNITIRSGGLRQGRVYQSLKYGHFASTVALCGLRRDLFLVWPALARPRRPRLDQRSNIFHRPAAIAGDSLCASCLRLQQRHQSLEGRTARHISTFGSVPLEPPVPVDRRVESRAGASPACCQGGLP